MKELRAVGEPENSIQVNGDTHKMSRMMKKRVNFLEPTPAILRSGIKK
jgi:hypothetical protein